jgi:hypothetical protein
MVIRSSVRLLANGRAEEKMRVYLAICKGCQLFSGAICTHKDCGCPTGREKKFLSKLA